MEKRTTHTPAVFTFVACGIALLATLFALCAPSSAFADDREIMAYSLDENQSRTFYYTTDAAISAGYEGKEIHLAVDWMFTGTMTVADSKSITINLNGHKITNQGGGTVIRMYENSSLTLKGYDDDGDAISHKFFYKGYNLDTGDEADASVVTGGLITGAYLKSTDVGGIRMDNNSTLTLDNVAIAGNSGGKAGGLFVKKKCNLYMKNGASIEQNKGSAGGIYVKEEDFNLYMDKSFIRKNYSSDSGGGLRSDADATRIYMTGDSAFLDNTAYSRAGGLNLKYSYFCVVSSDGTGKITNNKALNGSVGGLAIGDSHCEGNEGTIQGIEISENRSKNGAGGLIIAQEYVLLANCTIKDNVSQSGSYAGGVYVCNDHNIIRIVRLQAIPVVAKREAAFASTIRTMLSFAANASSKAMCARTTIPPVMFTCAIMRASALISPAVWRKARVWASALAKPALPR